VYNIQLGMRLSWLGYAHLQEPTSGEVRLLTMHYFPTE